MACKRGVFKRGMFVAVLAVLVLGLLSFNSVWAAEGADEALPGSVMGAAIDPTDGSPISGAEVAIGDNKTTTGEDGKFKLESLKAGTAELTITADGFAKDTWEVEVSDEEAYKLCRVGLLPERFVGKTCIIVESMPCLASVTLEGRLLTRRVDGENIPATTPALIRGIAAGAHNLAVSKEDYKTAKVIAEVEDSMLCRVAVKLKKKDRKFIGWWPLLGAGAVAIASSSGDDRAVSTYQISGTVRRTDGTPVPNTDIRVVQGSTTIVSGRTDDTGFYRVYLPEDSPGTYTVQARYADTFEDQKTVALTPEDRKGNADFVIPMDETYSISGTITEAGTGNPVAGATVYIGDSMVTTAANGSFTLGGLQEGEYVVRPEMSEWTFTPPTRNVTITAETGDVSGVNFTGTPNTYSISGWVTLGEGPGVPGVTVTAVPVLLAPAAVNAANGGYSATTQADGSYIITGLPAAKYEVRSEGWEMTFDPQTREATVNEDTGNATDVNFTAIPNRYSISGRVTDSSGAPMSDVPVTAQLTVKSSGIATAQTYEAATEADGTYVIGDLPPDTYKVTPQPLEGWNFVPPNRTVTVNLANGNATDVDFVGTPPATTFSISGMVAIEGEGPGLEGVMIVAQLQGESDSVAVKSGLPQAVTNEEGEYIISGLVSGTYIVQPQPLAGWAFDPQQREETVNPKDGNATGVDFFAIPDTYSISGCVTDEQEIGLVEVPVSAVAQVNGEAVRTAQSPVVHTDENGHYEFTDLGAGTYVVEPYRLEWTFDPPTQTVVLDPTHGNGTDVDFVGTPNRYSVSGRVTLESSEGEGIEGVLVTAVPAVTGGESVATAIAAAEYSANTAADGTYTIDSLPPDRYQVAPFGRVLTFEPPSRDVNVNITDGNATDVDFVGTPITQTYSISGTFIDGEATYPIPGATVTALLDMPGAQPVEVQTDYNGYYEFAGLPEGTYTVTPSMTPYAFDPAERTVTVNATEGNATDVDFEGYVTYSISGTVRDEQSTGLGGVTVKATPLVGEEAVVTQDNGYRSAVTEEDGTYTITGLRAGDYMVVPEAIGWRFEPKQQEATVNATEGNATDVDFEGYVTYSISGTVRDEQSTGLGGVTVKATPLVGEEAVVTQDNGYRSAVTEEDGTYTITGLRAGDYMVVPVAIGWRFEPEQQEATVNATEGNAADVDFVGFRNSFSICGTVVEDDEGATPLEGVVVAATHQQPEGAPSTASVPTATTDANGHYCITGLEAGEYIVVALRDGWTFDPVQQDVTVDPAVGDAEDVDFVGTLYQSSREADAVQATKASAFVTSLACLPTRAGGAQVTFTLSADAAVTAEVMNIAGRPIRLVVSDKPMTAGTATLLWDGKSGRGLNVPSGIYLIRLRAQDEAGGQSQALSTVQMMR